MGDPDARIQQSKIIIDLRDGPDRRARIARIALLADGQRGAYAGDVVDIGPVDAFEELAGVRRKRGHIATLALGIDGVECQAALAAA